MPVLVTGSIAIDQIMVFPDRFKNHILPDKIDSLNVAFMVPDLKRQWGGTGANIAYNLRRLELDPILLATAGRDFGEYAAWMQGHGIRLDFVRVLEDCFTANCFITTDLDNNQISSFHPGAMDRAHEARLDGIEEEIRVGIVAPNGKQAMIENAAALKQRGIPCVVDPGQGLPMFDGSELVELLEGAAVYVVNDYEWALTLEKTSLDEDAILQRVGALVVTCGEKGSRVRKGGLKDAVPMEVESADIPTITPDAVVDPTGCGDAYRSGILYALLHGLPLEQGARMGSLMGSLKISNSGPQSITIPCAEIHERFEREFGVALA
ncbi:MAG: carbohydrate kinase family protein [Myxococcota bacterium]